MARTTKQLGWLCQFMVPTLLMRRVGKALFSPTKKLQANLHDTIVWRMKSSERTRRRYILNAALV